MGAGPSGPAATAILTEVFAPAVLAALMPVVLALHATDDPLTGLGWAVLTVLFCSAIPYGVVLLGVRRGQLTDHHIGVREQRRRPMIVGLAAILVGLALLLLLGAPRELVAMVLVMLGVVLVTAVANHWWKLSAHAAVIAGSATVLVIVYGLPLLPSYLVAVGVSWSRVELRDHTTAQVILGGAAGVLVAAPTFLLVA